MVVSWHVCSFCMYVGFEMSVGCIMGFSVLRIL